MERILNLNLEALDVLVSEEKELFFLLLELMNQGNFITKKRANESIKKESIKKYEEKLLAIERKGLITIKTDKITISKKVAFLSKEEKGVSDGF